MKIYPSLTPGSSGLRSRQRGMAVVVVLALISIILIYIAANSRALYRLEREIKLTNQQQIQRLQRIKASDSSPAPTNTNSVLEIKSNSAEPTR